MPELPDVLVYLERLESLVGGKKLEKIRLSNPFLLRSYDPPIEKAHGRRVSGFRRIGKRLVLELEGELFLVLHLMIAGRLRWRERRAPIPKKVGSCAFDFPNGTVLLTEAGSKKRASLFLVESAPALSRFDRGGLEPLEANLEDFRSSLTRENRTLKRVLTDPRLFSGIGNAYSDEILFSAGLSPVKRTSQLTGAEIERLHAATRQTLTEWTDRLRGDAGDALPEKVTAFRKEMAVHGKFKEPCRVCGTKIQRIRYASNEVNYCPRCQTGGKVLADRSLSRLLRGDWPKRIEELEELDLKRVSKTAEVPGSEIRKRQPRAAKRRGT